MSKRILVVNGPNLGRLGKREPEIYGNQTLEDLEEMLRASAEILNVELEFFQSNHEGALIDRIEKAADEGMDGCIINPAALTHTSIALLDCIKSCNLPTVEIHLSQIYKREAFRNHSVTAPAAVALISGMGLEGYKYALEYLTKSN
jgi:3-dehydroquinate dehydratase-2